MKNVLLLILSMICIHTTLYSQWISQSSGITVRLRQLSVVDDNIVWCCGNDGTVLLTHDGGNNWEKKTAPNSTWSMYDISALDSLTAYITGMDQNNPDAVNTKIWKTTDGGNSWIEQYNNVTGFGDGIVMFDADNGVWWGDPDPYPSSAWEILTTQDGGVHWKRVPRTNYPPADSANEEYGAAAGICKYGNNVWFTGYSAIIGTPNSIYHSTDRGLHWTSSQLNTVSGNSSSAYLAFGSETNGVFVGLDGTRAYTNDGGVTWTVANNIAPKLRFVTNVPGAETYVAVGSTGAGLITKDGGVTWTELTGAPSLHLYGVEASANAVWACGNSGTIIKMNVTTDVDENRSAIPQVFELSQNYPNPFNPITKIKYTIPAHTSLFTSRERMSEGQVRVMLRVYDIIGNEVSTLVNEEQSAGEYEVKFSAEQLSSGVYFYKLSVGEKSESRKMIYFK